MPAHTLNLDNPANALSFAMIPRVQASYNGAGIYPPFVVTQAYVLSGAVTVGLSFWIPPQFWEVYPRGAPPNLPTVAKVTPALHGTVQYSVSVLLADEQYVNDLQIAIGGGDVDDILGCALCTGLAMMNGDLPLLVGPFLFP